MKTEFTSMKVKRGLWDKLDKGDPNAIKFVFEEFERLENLIRDYENAIEMLSETYKKANNKKEPHASF